MKQVLPSKRYEISIDPIIIPDYYTRIAKCKSLSKVQFKVAKPGLKTLKEYGIIDSYDILADKIDGLGNFYIDIEISAGRKGSNIPVSNLPAFLDKIITMVKKVKKDESGSEDGSNPTFTKARLRGFDANAGTVIPYDLLDEKLVQSKWVEKISDRSKYVDSEKMFNALAEAYDRQKDDALKYMEQME